MCFFYYIKNKTNINVNNLISISGELKHRGLDDDKIINNENFFVRFFRLSVIDVRLKASQPMFDTSGRYMIVFNGEIYNYKYLKGLLKNKNLLAILIQKSFYTP